MNKDEIAEEFTDQPWGNVIRSVVLVFIGEITGFLFGWWVFS